MNNTAEYLVLTVIALALGFYAWSELQYVLVDVLNQVASMITGGSL